MKIFKLLITVSLLLVCTTCSERLYPIDIPETPPHQEKQKQNSVPVEMPVKKEKIELAPIDFFEPETYYT